MTIVLEAANCPTCRTVTEHIVHRSKSGEINSLLCRRCKHKHIVGSN
jgi:ribosomal protein L44E